MGFPAPMAEFIILEHIYNSFKGKVLVLGKQTIHLTPIQGKDLFSKYGLAFDKNKIALDKNTRFAQGDKETEYITDASFFSSLGVDSFNVLDVSDYEGADIVLDICQTPPKSMWSAFDLILNGSVLDNVFDPIAALRNISLMLKPRGRIIHLEMATNFAYPYTLLSPVLFYDYYILNRFSDCKLYLGFFTDVNELTKGPWDLFFLEPPVGGAKGYLPSAIPSHAVQMIVAEKGDQSTYDVSPIQNIYRNKEQQEYFHSIENEISTSKRPVIDLLPEGAAPGKIGDFIGCGKMSGIQ